MAPTSLADAVLGKIERRLARQLGPAEERSVLHGLMEALLPLPTPSGGDASRLRLLLCPFSDALREPAAAQLWACVLEAIRLTEMLPTPSLSSLLEKVGASAGAVAGLAACSMMT